MHTSLLLLLQLVTIIITNTTERGLCIRFSRLNYAMNILKLIIYIIYRVIRDIIAYLQSYWFRFPQNTRTIKCEILTILYRLQALEDAVPRDCDFMWLHDKFHDAEKLLKYNPNWVLYTISERYAYFTLLPKPISEYNVKNAPFFFVKQFTDAVKLARMPIK